MNLNLIHFLSAFPILISSALFSAEDLRFNPVGKIGITVSNLDKYDEPPIVADVTGRPLFGISTGDAPGGGLEIKSVTPGGPADVAGLKEGDVVVKIDGMPIENKAAYSAKFPDLQSGQGLKCVVRRLGQEFDATVKVVPIEGEDESAWKAGFRRGDVILSVNEQATPSGYDFGQIKEAYTAGETVSVKVKRGKVEKTIQVALSFFPGEENDSLRFMLNPGGNHSKPIQHLMASALRNQLVTADQDGVILVWDLGTLKPIKRFNLPTGFGGIREISLAKDGKMLGVLTDFGVKRSALIIDLDRLAIVAFLQIPENRNDYIFSKIALAPDSSSVLCVQNLWHPELFPIGETRLHIFDLESAGLLQRPDDDGMPVFLDGTQIIATPGTGTNPGYQASPHKIALGISDGTVRRWKLQKKVSEGLEFEPMQGFSFLENLLPIRKEAQALKPETVIAPGDSPARDAIHSWIQPRQLGFAENGSIIVLTGDAGEGALRLSELMEATHWAHSSAYPRKESSAVNELCNQRGLIYGRWSGPCYVAEDGLWYGRVYFGFSEMGVTGRQFTDKNIVSPKMNQKLSSGYSSESDRQDAIYAQLKADWSNDKMPVYFPIGLESKWLGIDPQSRSVSFGTASRSLDATSDEERYVYTLDKLKTISSTNSLRGGYLSDRNRLFLSEDDQTLGIARFNETEATKNLARQGEGLGDARTLFDWSDFKNGKRMYPQRQNVPQSLPEFRDLYIKSEADKAHSFLDADPRARFLDIGRVGKLDSSRRGDTRFFHSRFILGERLLLEYRQNMYSMDEGGLKYDVLDDLPTMGLPPLIFLLADSSRSDEIVKDLVRGTALSNRILSTKVLATAKSAAVKLAELGARLEKVSQETVNEWKQLLPNIKDLRFEEGGLVSPITGVGEQCWVIECSDDGPNTVQFRRGIWRTSLNGDGGHAIVEWGRGMPKSSVISKDGKRLFCFDGLTRLIEVYDTVKAQLLAYVFISQEGEWVWWTPEGYFSASQNAAQWIGWCKNQGMSQQAQFFSGDQLASHFERADIVSAVLQRGVSATEIAKELGLTFDLKTALMKVPSVRLEGIEDGQVAGTDIIQVSVEAADTGGGLKDIALFHNGKRVPADGPPSNSARGNFAVKNLRFTLTLIPGDNQIRAQAANDKETIGTPAELNLKFNGVQATSTLHLLTIGLNRYQNPRYNLTYCVPDADACAEAFAKRAPGLFAEVKTYALRDAEATKLKIAETFAAIAQAAKPSDVFIFCYAGHGVMGEKPDGKPGDNEFYLIPHDITRMYGDPEMLAEKGVSKADLETWCANIPARKQVMLLDTCQSGGLVDTFAMRGVAEEKAIAMLARSTGTMVIASTGAEAYARESKDIGHGIFTKVLLDGLLEAKADSDKDGKITVKEMDTYIGQAVPELSQKLTNTPQFPTSYARGQDFPIGIVK